MVALLLQAVGLDHVVTLDLHAPQIEGFFHIPVDSLTAVPTLAETLLDRLPEGTVVVAPCRCRAAGEPVCPAAEGPGSGVAQAAPERH
jgi:phosphoribosylpyrophosphate synthetase